MKMLFLFPFLFLSFLCQCQNLNDNIKLTIKVKRADSKYLLIPQLQVFSDSQDINIHKKLYYGNEVDMIADCNFFLQKEIGQYLINMYVQAFRNPIPDSNYFILRKFTVNSILRDTINLNEYFPFDAGDYRALLVLSYYIRGIKYQVYSPWVEFKVHTK
jgi:hypothetical protein